jgi:hypothetical protein
VLGLDHLLEVVGQKHPCYLDLLVCQQQLYESICQSREYGDTEALRFTRSLVIRRLNGLALALLGVSYNELCGLNVYLNAGE